MGLVIELKEAGLTAIAPARETGRGPVDIGINIEQRLALCIFRRGVGIAAIVVDDQRHDPHVIFGTQRVQLEEFTGIVFVRVAARIYLIVQVVQHGGTFGHRLQHRAEVAEHISPNDIAIVMHHHWRGPRIPAKDIKVVKPMFREHFR